MTVRRFLVTYKVGNSTGTTSLMLYGGTDSEAREEVEAKYDINGCLVAYRQYLVYL